MDLIRPRQAHDLRRRPASTSMRLVHTEVVIGRRRTSTVPAQVTGEYSGRSRRFQSYIGSSITDMHELRYRARICGLRARTAVQAAPGQHSTWTSPVAGRRVTLTGSDDAWPVRAGSSTGNRSQTGKGCPQGPWDAQTGRDSSETQWGLQPGQASPGMLKVPRSRASEAKPLASRRTFLPGSWAPCQPPCPGCPPCRCPTPAARSRRRSR
jgi:hypothetical protein